VTLLSAAAAERLRASMDVEVSADGITSRRWRVAGAAARREDLRWVNGIRNNVIDHDLVADRWPGRWWRRCASCPVLSSDPWTLSEVLLHPATAPAARGGWDEWRRSAPFVAASAALPSTRPRRRPRGLVLPLDAGGAAALSGRLPRLCA
jgi:hypothetical protein